VKDRYGLTSKWLGNRNRRKILEALKDNRGLTFTELLNLKIVSVGALNTHLKTLVMNQDIEKDFNKTKNQVVYRITEKGIIPLQTESMIHNLGLFATYVVVAKKLNLKEDFLEVLHESIKNYAETKSKIPAKKYMKYLKENYPLEM